MIYNVYDPSYGPFPPEISASELHLQCTALDGGNNVAYLDGMIYLISAADGGTLRVCTADTEQPLVCATITGLGNLRQIVVSAKASPGRIIAAVTARECGLYIVDVTDAANPCICCHYDSVEFATGVAFSGPYLAIGCRTFGVELLDVSDPAHPRHLSVIRAGEVQSICISGKYLYTGSWGDRQVNVFDVSNTAAPKKCASIPLEGRGDGLCVRNGLLCAAFGQHLRPDRGDAPETYGYGRGNGFALWDVHDPRNPKQLSATRFPIRYFAYWDMWDAVLCGDYAVIAHTLNGVWIYNISDPKNPMLKEHIAIPTGADPMEIVPATEKQQSWRPFMLPFDPKTQMYAPVTGVALADGRLFIAARYAPLHVAYGAFFAPETESPCELSEGSAGYYEVYAGEKTTGVKIVPTAAQVHAAAYDNGRIYAACGMDGIRIYNRSLDEIGQMSTGAIARDVRLSNGLVYVANGRDGVLILQPEGNSLQEIGRYCPKNRTCVQVVPSENGRYLMVHADDRTLQILDVSLPQAPMLVLEKEHAPGLLYHRQMSFSGVGGRYYGCYWNGNMTRWYDLSGEIPEHSAFRQEHLQLGFGGGLTGLSEPYKALAVIGGGYAVIDIRDEMAGCPYEIIAVDGTDLRGKPVISNNRLFVTDRLDGNVTVCDISDLSAPKLLAKYNFSGHPDLVCPVGGGAVIPLGHQGLAWIAVE